jgi:hypothetical protein
VSISLSQKLLMFISLVCSRGYANSAMDSGSQNQKNIPVLELAR